MDKILGAGFKSIDLNEPNMGCDFGDTIPYNELNKNYKSHKQRDFSHFEILEADEEDPDK
jgi:hypothetical protein